MILTKFNTCEATNTLQFLFDKLISTVFEFYFFGMKLQPVLIYNKLKTRSDY
jgi:hypothetical protein